MSQNLSVNEYKWVGDLSEYDKGFIKNCNEKIDKGYFLEIDIQYPEELHELHNALPLLAERIRILKVEELVVK